MKKQQKLIGFPRTPYSRIVLKSKSSQYTFIKHFYGKSESTVQDVFNFRFHLIATRSNQGAFAKLSSFETAENKKELLESVFLEPLNNEYMDIIMEAINEKRITLNEIIGNFIMNPQASIMRNVL